jgi:lauroyl/myristoyl acyltransferase
MRRQHYNHIDYLEHAGWYLLRFLPADVVSAAGLLVGYAHFAIYSFTRREWMANMRASLTHITGDADRWSLTMRMIRHFGLLGRTLLEISVLHRFLDEGRICFSGVSYGPDPERPTIFVSAHLANWELVALSAVKAGIPGKDLYWPPDTPARRYIAEAVRGKIAEKFPGGELVPNTPDGLRDMMQTVATGENILLFVDERLKRLVWAPPLGRDLPYKGNRMLAARLAIKHNARVVPVYMRRMRGARYECVAEPELELPRTGDELADTRTLADAIAARVEVWVRERPEHWFWLGDFRHDKPFPKVDGDT